MKKTKLILMGILIVVSTFMIGCSIQEKKAEDLPLENKKTDTTKDKPKEEPKPEEPKIEYVNIDKAEVRIPILMYHSISDRDPNNSLLVPPEMFEEQVAWLAENGFTAMSMQDVVESMETGKVPKKPVVITFDDGYLDNYTSAFPILVKHNMKGTFFVITGGVDSGYYMYSDMLKEMQNAGMSIENHTSNHLELNKLSREEAYSSIKDGQDFLRDVIGSKGDFLCYPVGRYSDETIEIAKELGIKAAVTTNGGISSLDNGMNSLKRIRVSPMGIESFKSIFNEYMN